MGRNGDAPILGKDDVMVTRVAGSRWILVGLKNRGYARLRPADAAELAQAIWSLCGYDGTPETN